MPDKPAAPAILSGQRDATGVMRGRDVRFALQNRNIDPQLIETIAKLAEVNHTNVLAVAELATMQDQIINIVQNFADISQNMKDKMAQIERGTTGEAEDEVLN